MKLLGIDYGTKRVGVAISDDAGTMAFPKTVLPNDTALVSNVKTLVRDEGIERIVVGESKNLNGEANPVAEAINGFVALLKEEVIVPVYFEPEFYTSHEARRLVHEAGNTKKGEAVDAEAAAVILNSYILRSRV